jgi:dipeptidyl-peptidase-4
MRISRPLFLCTFLTLAFAATAQQQLTLKDAVLKPGTDYAPERLKGLQWVEGSPTYSYVKGDQLMTGTLGKSMDLAVASLTELNAFLPEDSRTKAMPPITWESTTTVRFLQNGRLYRFDTTTRKGERIGALPGEAGNEDIAPATGHVACTVGNDLYVLAGGKKETRVTNDGAEDAIVNGKTVHREEYGITKGTFWSPQGNLLAFYRMDESMVTPYQLEDISTKPSTFNTIRYPMAGATSHHVTVGVYDARNGKTVFLKTGEPKDQYLTNISWEHDERALHVVHLDRATQNLRMVRYDALTGEPLGTLLEEHDDKYLEPLHPARFLRTRPTQFIHWSQRDGWHHLYLYDVKKGLVRQLTKGAWEVKEILGMDPKESYVVVEGTAEVQAGRPTGALETHLYRVDLATGKTARLTTAAGSHHGQLSTNGQYLIDMWSSTSVPGRTEVIDVRSGQGMKTLVDSKDPLAGVTKGSIELLTIPGEAGDQLNARLIKPSTFDPKRRYPVLIYVYNGPHAQLVANTFLGAAQLWMLEAAERGYLIWTVDGHGSAHRGRAFEQIVHRRLGEVEVKDQMRGVDWLKAQPYVDPERIAVHGWSFGGHITTAMLTRHPGVFKAGVAGGPVMDWSMYEVMYTERYMDTPAENPDGYKNTAMPPMATQLQDDLLIITGGADNVVLPEHSLTFLKSCISNGVQVDFFEYPCHEHNVRGKDRVHLMEKVLGYLDARMLPRR